MTMRGDQHVDDWAEIAVDYLDGRLDQDTRMAVEAHLSGCPECAARLRRQQYVVNFLQETILDDPPEDLEYRAIGELIFPSPGTQPMIRPSEGKKVYHTPRWFATLRTWLPVSAAVVALLVAVVAYGIVRSNSGSNTVTDSARMAVPTSTAAGAATTAAPLLGETSPVGVDATVTTAAAAGAAGGESPASTETSVFIATADPTAMVRALQSAQSPTYVAFRAATPIRPTEERGAPASSTTTGSTLGAGSVTTSTGLTTETTLATTVSTMSGALSADMVSALLNQINQFTGLRPVDQSLWLAGPTFAVFLPRKDAAKLVDLIRSISASMGLIVSVEGQPPASAQDACARLLQQKRTFPVLQAHLAPQPSIFDYDFTTSTLVPASSVAQTGSTETLPDEAGTHVIVVIWIAE